MPDITHFLGRGIGQAFAMLLVMHLIGAMFGTVRRSLKQALNA